MEIPVSQPGFNGMLDSFRSRSLSPLVVVQTFEGGLELGSRWCNSIMVEKIFHSASNARLLHLQPGPWTSLVEAPQGQRAGPKGVDGCLNLSFFTEELKWIMELSTLGRHWDHLGSQIRHGILVKLKSIGFFAFFLSGGGV